jgi:uncharacterized membrane protein
MTELLIAIAVFVIAHAVPPAPPVRTRLIHWLGRRAYLVCYSLLSLGLIVWVIVAARRAPYMPLWDAASWQALVPVVVMPLALWLLLIGLAEPNPLSISMRAANAKTEPGAAAAVTRHPVLWGFLLWGASHIPPNGDVVALILFGGIALFALSGFAVLDRRARRRLGEAQWQKLVTATSLVPFIALPAGRAHIRLSSHLLLSVALALAVYLWLLLQGHTLLFSRDPLLWLTP